MVDTVGVEILCHFAESAYPPLAVVLQHLVPVVCRESPVLAIGRERIGRGTSLTIQVEILRFNPCLNAVATDADGDVALQDDTMCTGILMGSMHLTVEVVLHVAPEVGHLFVNLGQWLGPCRELSRSVEVAIVAKLCVWLQPLLVVCAELFVGSRTLDCCPFLLEQHLQILQFGAEHALVVNLWQRIQFLT